MLWLSALLAFMPYLLSQYGVFLEVYRDTSDWVVGALLIVGAGGWIVLVAYHATALFGHPELTAAVVLPMGILLVSALGIICQSEADLLGLFPDGIVLTVGFWVAGVLAIKAISAALQLSGVRSRISWSQATALSPAVICAIIAVGVGCLALSAPFASYAARS